MKVSALVSTYNSSAYLAGCLEDLINQTLYQKNLLEIIVIDSGSEENEGEVVRLFQKQYTNIKYLRTENRKSLYEAWNQGIQDAEGLYLCNANTDDRHDEECLERLSNALDEDGKISLAYGNIDKVFSLEPSVKDEKKTPCPSQDFFPASLFVHYPYGAQPMWRAEIHRKVGFFNSKYEVLGDYEFALRLVSNGLISAFIPEAKGEMLWLPGALSRRDSKVYEERDVLLLSMRNEHMIQNAYLHYLQQNRLPLPKNLLNECLLDLGLRALCFFPQFAEGKAAFDLDVMEFAYSSNVSDRRFLNNRVLLDLLLGNEIDPDFLDLGNSTNCEVMQHNQKVISSAYEDEDFLLFGPDAAFPTEFELKNTRSRYLKRYQEDLGTTNAIFSFSILAFKDYYLQSLDLDDLYHAKKIYLWGLNHKSKFLFSFLKKRTCEQIHILDSNSKSKNWSGIKVLDPRSVLLEKNMDSSSFILCMSSTHWKSIEQKIKVARPNSSIHHLHP